MQFAEEPAYIGRDGLACAPLLGGAPRLFSRNDIAPTRFDIIAVRRAAGGNFLYRSSPLSHYAFSDTASQGRFALY